MRIYNEIVIDMNPDSLSYGETLHEDSFEYEGDLDLLQNWYYTHQGEDQIKVGDDYWEWDEYGGGAGVYKKIENISETYTQEQDVATGQTGGEFALYDEAAFIDKTADLIEDTTVGPGGTQFSGNITGMEGERIDAGEATNAIKNLMREEGYDPAYDVNKDGNINIQDITAGVASGLWSKEKGSFDKGEEFGFTYAGNQFDPTQEEFQQYVGTTGGISTLLKGFEVGAEYEKYFDPPDLTELDRYREKSDLQMDSLGEGRRAAETAYGRAQERGRQSDVAIGQAEEQAGMKAGRSLFDIKAQADVQAARSGFARHGGIESTVSTAKGGVWQDLIGQQQALEGERAAAATTLGAAKSDWTGAQAAYTTGMAGAGLDLKTSVADFWGKEEEKFYGTLGQVESWKKASDRRLKDNIIIVDKSLSGINIYTFNYKDPDRYGYGLYQGVMSDEIPTNAVIVGEDGYDMVDYSKIDVEFKRI